MTPRAYALAILIFTALALVAVASFPSGATFTAPATNPGNQVATATLAAPTGVTASVQPNGGTVRVAWTATSSAWASGHRVLRAPSSSGPFSQIAQIAGRTTTTYDDVPGPGTFYYVVRGYYSGNGAAWESVDSAQASAKPLDHFTFNAIAAQHSGTGFSVTVIARAQDNSTVTAFTGTVTLGAASGTIAPTTSSPFASGSLTQSITITGPYTSAETVSATGGAPSRTGTSAAFTLNHFRATGVAIANHAGGVAGKAEAGDTVVLTFSEAAATASLGTCPAADSASDLLTNNGATDTLSANGAALTFGTISLGHTGYFTASDVAKRSTCAWSAGNTVLTITLAGVKSAGTVAGASTAAWTPASSITSAAGEAIDTTQTPSLTAVLF